MSKLAERFIVVGDIESLGTPGDCRSTFVAMPTFAFVGLKSVTEAPYIVFGQLDVQAQLTLGAQVSASTIAFWMEEALRGSIPAQTIVKALRVADGMSQVVVCNPTKAGNDCVGKQTFHENIDAFYEVAEVLEGMVHEQGIDEKTLRFYGNGPQFDMSIYETVAAKANTFRASAPAIVPWKFWNVSSARNPRDYFTDLGGDWKALEAEAAAYATDVIGQYNLTRFNVSAVKHDAVFDALVEAYCVKSIESILKI